MVGRIAFDLSFGPVFPDVAVVIAVMRSGGNGPARRPIGYGDLRAPRRHRWPWQVLPGPPSGMVARELLARPAHRPAGPSSAVSPLDLDPPRDRRAGCAGRHRPARGRGAGPERRPDARNGRQVVLERSHRRDRGSDRFRDGRRQRHGDRHGVGRPSGRERGRDGPAGAGHALGAGFADARGGGRDGDPHGRGRRRQRARDAGRSGRVGERRPLRRPR